MIYLTLCERTIALDRIQTVMKTKAKKQIHVSTLQVVNVSQTPADKVVLRILYKSDLANHRFAQHGNEHVQDARTWDHAWFAHYE